MSQYFDGKTYHDDSPEEMEELQRAKDAAWSQKRPEYARKWNFPNRQVVNVLESEPEETDATKAVAAFMASDDTMLVLSGGVGVGKSAAAVSSLRHIKPGVIGAYDPSFRQAARFIGAVELTKSLGFEEADKKTFAEMERIGLLVVDDLGAEHIDKSGWYLSHFGALVNTRYESCLKTIYTTNLGVADFKARYGERVTDRIRECGQFVNLGGKTRRTKRKQPKPSPEHPDGAEEGSTPRKYKNFSEPCAPHLVTRDVEDF